MQPALVQGGVALTTGPGRCCTQQDAHPHCLPPGEAYDKVARMLGLESKPHGGAALEALARGGDPTRYPLAVPMKKYPNCDFSYAGLKTGVRLCIEKELPEPGAPGGWVAG